MPAWGLWEVDDGRCGEEVAGVDVVLDGNGGTVR